MNRELEELKKENVKLSTRNLELEWAATHRHPKVITLPQIEMRICQVYGNKSCWPEWERRLKKVVESGAVL